MLKRFFPRWPRFSPLLLAAFALLGSSCLWGVVTDANTGAPLRGVRVTCTDSYGQTLSTFTDANGIYAFDQAREAVPARGQTTLTVNAAGYESYSESRLIEYNENPKATLENMSGFWEIQNATLVPPPNRYHSETGGYSLTFPPQWEALIEPDYPVIVGYAPYSDPAGASCMATSMPSIPNIDTNWVATALLKEIRGDCISYKENHRTVAEIDMMPATRVVFTCDLRTEGGGPVRTMSMKSAMYLANRGENLYILMCMSLQTSFPGRELIFNDVASSFRTD